MKVARSLLDGNRDHLLTETRAELMKQEQKVESLYNCISELPPQMTRFRDEKVCNSWLQVRIDDHRIQSGYKYKSELQNPDGKKSVLGITSAW